MDKPSSFLLSSADRTRICSLFLGGYSRERVNGQDRQVMLWREFDCPGSRREELHRKGRPGSFSRGYEEAGGGRRREAAGSDREEG